jgi:hypothetical protein
LDAFVYPESALDTDDKGQLAEAVLRALSDDAKNGSD